MAKRDGKLHLFCKITSNRETDFILSEYTNVSYALLIFIWESSTFSHFDSTWNFFRNRDGNLIKTSKKAENCSGSFKGTADSLVCKRV